MKRALSLSSILAAAVLVSPSFVQAQAKPAAAAGRVIEIEGTDAMKFSVTSLTAKPGERITVRLKAVGALPKMAMQHNFVLLAAGAKPEDVANKSLMAASTAYIAPEVKAQVLASTPMAGAGETVSISFNAPAKPGSYVFICTFPGHFGAGMKGTLVVK